MGMLAAVLGLAGCNTAGGGSGGVLGGLFGSPMPAAPAPAAVSSSVDIMDCPTVDVLEGGAALTLYTGGRTGDPAAVRTQISIGQVARECIEQPDGSLLVKVGVEGRALAGPAGGTGRLDAPVQVVVRRNDTVYARRARRVPVAIPPGDTQGSFTVVEDGIVVPAGVGTDFQIEVGLGGPAPARRR